MKIKILFVICVIAMIQSCDRRHKATPDLESLERAQMSLQVIYDNYSVPGTPLLRENFPYDDRSGGGLAVLEDDAPMPNPYSYLCPFSGTLSAVTALMESLPEYEDTLRRRVLPGLREYFDERRKPEAYSSYIVSEPPADRYYDDNIWIGIDFVDLYRITSDKWYLERAGDIWHFVESGTDDVLGGGIYWCEQKKSSKNACSNAPGAVFALKLYLATNEREYLDRGRELYEWTKKTLIDTSDNLYFDNIGLDGKIIKWKFAYNSGEMMKAAALLYDITGDNSYLCDAQRIAEGCYGRFFTDYELPDGRTVRIIKKGNAWFQSVMVRGFIELYGIDGESKYLDAVRNTLDVAWKFGRSPEGLFNSDYTGRIQDNRKWLLTQCAMTEMYARIALLGID